MGPPQLGIELGKRVRNRVWFKVSVRVSLAINTYDFVVV